MTGDMKTTKLSIQNANSCCRIVQVNHAIREHRRHRRDQGVQAILDLQVDLEVPVVRQDQQVLRYLGHPFDLPNLELQAVREVQHFQVVQYHQVVP